MKKKIKAQDQTKEQLARALADYDNLRKRVETQKEAWEKEACAKVVAKLLPVLDILIKARQHNNDEGLALAVKEFKNAFLELGVEEINVAKGDEFNPLYEEVIETVQGGKGQKVAEVVQSGWKIRDFVIRPAKVKVYTEKEVMRGNHV